MEKLVKLNFKVNDQVAHSNLTALCIILCVKWFFWFLSFKQKWVEVGFENESYYNVNKKMQ